MPGPHPVLGRRGAAVGLAVDYAWTHPNPAAIKAAGYDGVMRYLSHTDSKNLTGAEALQLHAAQLWIGCVWETTAGRAGQGAAAGQSDVFYAEDLADQIGYPDRAVIFYAVDYDADPADVLPYFHAIKNSPSQRRPVGVYGGLDVVRAVMRAGLAEYGWQTVAWSRGQLLDSTHLYQRLHPGRKITGTPSGFDENAVVHPFPAWVPGKPAEPKQAPAPAPAPVPREPQPETRGDLVDQAVALDRKALTRTHNPGRRRKLRTSLAALLSIRPFKRRR